MATRYTYTCTLPYSTGTVPEADEMDVEVSFSVAWGSPGTGRPYYGPPENYDEGSPDEVEDLRLMTVNGATKPFPEEAFGAGEINQEFEAAILQQIAQSHTDGMLEIARDREAYWADEAADYRREASR